MRQLHTVHLVCPGSAGSAGAWEVAAALGPRAVMRLQSATIAARSSGLVSEARNGVAYQRVAPMKAMGVPSIESMVVMPPIGASPHELAPSAAHPRELGSTPGRPIRARSCSRAL